MLILCFSLCDASPLQCLSESLYSLTLCWPCSVCRCRYPNQNSQVNRNCYWPSIDLVPVSCQFNRAGSDPREASILGHIRGVRQSKYNDRSSDIPIKCQTCLHVLNGRHFGNRGCALPHHAHWLRVVCRGGVPQGWAAWAKCNQADHCRPAPHRVADSSPGGHTPWIIFRMGRGRSRVFVGTSCGLIVTSAYIFDHHVFSWMEAPECVGKTNDNVNKYKCVVQVLTND